MAGMPNERVLPVPVQYRPVRSRPVNTGTKASNWTGVKLVIPLRGSTPMTFWVHLFLDQYGFDVEVNLELRKLILGGTSTPSSSENDNYYNPSLCPPFTCF